MQKTNRYLQKNASLIQRLVGLSAVGLMMLTCGSVIANESQTTVTDQKSQDVKTIALIQPISVSTLKAAKKNNTVQIDPKDLRIAAKWRTNLLIPTESPSKANPPVKKKIVAKKVAEKKPSQEIFPIAEESEIPNPVAQAEVIETPKTAEIPADATEEDNYCYTPERISSLSVNIDLPSGKLPTDNYTACGENTSPTGDNRLAGGWAMFDYHWAATGLCHRPLYFEEVNAERYGYTPSYVFQPVISAVRFFATIPALPYKMAVDCPRDCIYTLGHYRPGSCNPWRVHRLPFKLGAAAVETGFIAGLILLIP